MRKITTRRETFRPPLLPARPAPQRSTPAVALFHMTIAAITVAAAAVATIVLLWKILL